MKRASQHLRIKPAAPSSQRVRPFKPENNVHFTGSHAELPQSQTLESRVLLSSMIPSVDDTPEPIGPGVAALATFVQTYEAENATLYSAPVQTSHPGYTGTGFVDFDHPAGDYAEFNVAAPAAGLYSLAFRHASYDSYNHPMQLSVNGRLVTDCISFATTGSWTNWQTSVLAVVSLQAGNNRIRLTGVNYSGPNLDSLTVSNSAPSLIATGMKLSVAANPSAGSYSITGSSPAWTFAGSVASSMTDAVLTSGKDNLGTYNGLTLDWQAGGLRVGEMRTYANRSSVQFLVTNTFATYNPAAAFPLVTPPSGLHVFSYSNTVFSTPSFSGNAGGGSPWLMFDNSGNAAIISPASDFMVADIYSPGVTNPTSTTGVTIASGFESELRNLPAGFTHKTLLTFSNGIGDAWNCWGKAMTDLSSKSRPGNQADVGLKTIGYFTDAGGAYYNNYDPQLGYQGTLVALAKKFKDLGINLGYMQLDSWWYIKSQTNPDGSLGNPYKNPDLPSGSWNLYGGLLDYTAHPFVFPNGLAAFQQLIGLPIMTHNRWVDLASNYRNSYTFSGLAGIDPKWWSSIFSYIKSANAFAYEQDWLSTMYEKSPQLKSTLDYGNLSTDTMANTAKQLGLSVQYCTELPRYFLQGSRYSNLTSVRVSNDRFERSKWDAALYTSQLATSLGEWPWVDTFNSSETSNIILATLSAGMVGVGDDINSINTPNIRKVALNSGVIVKPDTSIVPINTSYVNDAVNAQKPMIAAAYTDHGALRTSYVFAYPRSSTQSQIQFRTSDLGMTGDAWVYNTVTGESQKITTGQTFSAVFTDKSPTTGWAYYVVAPVTKSGW